MRSYLLAIKKYWFHVAFFSVSVFYDENVGMSAAIYAEGAGKYLLLTKHCEQKEG